MCNNLGALRCEVCDAQYYSKACQLLDWPTHKLLCKLSKEYRTTPKRATLKCRYMPAVLFKANACKPSWTWMKFTKDGKDWDAEYEPYFGNAPTDTKTIHKNRVLGRTIPNKITLVCRDEFHG